MLMLIQNPLIFRNKFSAVLNLVMCCKETVPLAHTSYLHTVFYTYKACWLS